MTPWWIISILDSDENASISTGSFRDLLDHQVREWSIAAYIMNPVAGDSWWRIDNFSFGIANNASDFQEEITGFLYNPLRVTGSEKVPRIGGDIDATRINIAIVGDARSETTRTFAHCIAHTIRRNRDVLFPGIDINITGLIFLPQDSHEHLERAKIVSFLTETDSMMRIQEVARRPFDQLVVLQDNNVSNVNTTGYTELDNDQACSSITAVMLHLMITNSGVFTDGRNVENPAYYSVGALGLFNDWDTHLHSEIAACSAQVLNDLKGSSDRPFSDPTEVPVATQKVKDEFSLVKILNSLKEESPSFAFESKVWSQPTDSGGKILSPWRLFSVDLLLCYFRIFLRYLPIRISEYSRIYLTDKLKKFGDHLADRKRALFIGTEIKSGLKHSINETICEVLSGKHGSARSLLQIELVIRDIKFFCGELSRSDTELNNIDTFNKFEPFEIPKHLAAFYNTAPDISDQNEEKLLYERIVENIKRHPLPLALFVRSLLISVVLWFLGGAIITRMSPWVLNIGDTGELALTVVVAALPIAMAVWHYQVTTLNHLQKSVREYVGAVLRLAQVRAKAAIKTAVRDLGVEGERYCDELLQNLSEQSNSLNLIEKQISDFRSNTFSVPLSGKLVVPGRNESIGILASGLPKIEFNVAAGQRGRSEFTADDRNYLVKAVLDSGTNTQGHTAAIICRAISGEGQEDLCSTINGAVESSVAKTLVHQNQSSHLSLLRTEEEIHRKNLARHIASLASTPAVFHAGVAGIAGPIIEIRSADSHSIKDLIPLMGTVITSETKVGGLLCFASFKRFSNFGDLATIRAIRNDDHVNQKVLTDRSPQRVFVLKALLEIPNGEATLYNIASGAAIEVDKETGRLVGEFQSLDEEEAPDNMDPDF